MKILKLSNNISLLDDLNDNSPSPCFKKSFQLSASLHSYLTRSPTQNMVKLVVRTTVYGLRSQNMVKLVVRTTVYGLRSQNMVKLIVRTTVYGLRSINFSLVINGTILTFILRVCYYMLRVSRYARKS